MVANMVFFTAESRLEKTDLELFLDMKPVFFLYKKETMLYDTL